MKRILRNLAIDAVCFLLIVIWIVPVQGFSLIRDALNYLALDVRQEWNSRLKYKR